MSPDHPKAPAASPAAREPPTKAPNPPPRTQPYSKPPALPAMVTAEVTVMASASGAKGASGVAWMRLTMSSGQKLSNSRYSVAAMPAREVPQGAAPLAEPPGQWPGHEPDRRAGGEQSPDLLRRKATLLQELR